MKFHLVRVHRCDKLCNVNHRLNWGRTRFVGVFILALATRANAECTTPNQGCFAAETLRLQPGISDFVTVGPTEITRELDAGFWMSYAYGQVRIATPSPGPSAATSYQATGHVFSPTLFVRIPVRRSLELTAIWGAGIQSGAGVSPLSGGLVTPVGIQSPRLGFSFDLARALDVPVQWLGRFDMTVPIGRGSDFYGETNVLFVPSTVIRGNSGIFSFAGSLDLRLRPKVTFLGQDVGTEMGSSFGVGLLIVEGLSAALEYRNVTSFVGSPTLHELLETVTLRRWKIAMTASYGNGLTSGFRSPIHRATVGISIPLESNL